MPDVSHAKLFRDLDRKETQRIGNRMREVTHSAGSEIVTAGSGGVAFLVILDGEVEVRVPDGRVRTLGPGDHFGEIALLTDDQRSATIVAKSDVKLAGLTAWDFKPFLIDHPEVAYRMAQNLARLIPEAEAR
jgi:CRP-like cAMP-binding protein